MISDDDLREVFSYNHVDGFITYKTSRQGRMRAGSRAGAVSGYHRVVRAGGRFILEHRLAWFLYYGNWPAGNVDHANGDGLDNRIENLRLCNQSQNMANSRISKRNSSGEKGVTWKASHKKWCARIMQNGRSSHLGYFESKDGAAAAYATATKNIFKEFARTT